LARPLLDHRIDRKILVVFMTLTFAALGLQWLLSEVLEGDTFAIDRAVLRGLRSGANAAIAVGPTWLVDPMIEVTALGNVAVLPLIAIPGSDIWSQCESQRLGIAP
jgi:undecaprenyl-diphosphatase